MSEPSPWPDVPKEAEWSVSLMQELLESTDQTREELVARARQLREEAERTELDGHRQAALALADRYEAAAEARVTAG